MIMSIGVRNFWRYAAPVILAVGIVGLALAMAEPTARAATTDEQPPATEDGWGHFAGRIVVDGTVKAPEK